MITTKTISFDRRIISSTYVYNEENKSKLLCCVIHQYSDNIEVIDSEGVKIAEYLRTIPLGTIIEFFTNHFKTQSKISYVNSN